MAENLQLIVDALRDPKNVLPWSPKQWTAAFSLARRELVLGHFAAEVEAAGLMAQLPERARQQLQDGLRFAAHSHVQARHDALYFGSLLGPLGCPVAVLKGSAYVLADQPASAGRLAGDLDILIPRSWLGAAEQALAQHGWKVSFKSDYDDAYYRDYAHELPPIVHAEKSNVLDLHHSILPMTSRLKPKPDAMLTAAQDVPGSTLKILSREDQILHSATHLFYDGDLTGGLRNLHDVHRLIGPHSSDSVFWSTLLERATLHQLVLPLFYALRYCQQLLGTKVPAETFKQLSAQGPSLLSIVLMDKLVICRLTQATVGKHPAKVRLATFLLYIRSHWLRMPPALLAKHLWTKFRMARRG
jgi:hypothetical protein